MQRLHPALHPERLPKKSKVVYPSPTILTRQFPHLRTAISPSLVEFWKLLLKILIPFIYKTHPFYLQKLDYSFSSPCKELDENIPKEIESCTKVLELVGLGTQTRIGLTSDSMPYTSLSQKQLLIQFFRCITPEIIVLRVTIIRW